MSNRTIDPVQTITNALCGVMSKHGMHLTADEITALGFKFWCEGPHLWMRNRDGVEISLRQLIIECVGESMKRDFIASIERQETIGEEQQ